MTRLAGLTSRVMFADHSAYPPDVSDEERALLSETSIQRDPDLREVLNGMRDIVETGTCNRNRSARQ